MSELNCEIILAAKMAELDGEKAEISAEETNLHLAICENCRTEFEQIKHLHRRLQTQTRCEQQADLWSAIERKIGGQTVSPISPKTFFLFGSLLVAYKSLEIFPERDFGLLFKVVPLVLIIALFVFIKENPFKINAELAPEK